MANSDPQALPSSPKCIAIEQPRFVDQEADAANRPCLRLNDNLSKSRQPGIDVIALAAKLKRRVIDVAVVMDRCCECR
jgi:hypothetical protein